MQGTPDLYVVCTRHKAMWHFGWDFLIKKKKKKKHHSSVGKRSNDRWKQETQRCEPLCNKNTHTLSVRLEKRKEWRWWKRQSGCVSFVRYKVTVRRKLHSKKHQKQAKEQSESQTDAPSRAGKSKTSRAGSEKRFFKFFPRRCEVDPERRAAKFTQDDKRSERLAAGWAQWAVSGRLRGLSASAHTALSTCKLAQQTLKCGNRCRAATMNSSREPRDQSYFIKR